MDEAAGGEFVEGWLVAQLLGEGAYGEVRLLVHARTGACVALKAVRGEEAGGGGAGAGGAAREAALHRALRHAHVLRCLGARAHRGTHYTFLEYAAGGDLFERIEPDQGMPEVSARRYFTQLLHGLRYLHARGVAHRDIKPENLLLDHKDDLKISDFGMATVFRHEGRGERLLSRVCGTVPYAAPEVLSAASRPYRAQPADLWAAAVVLVAMLAGELPWERAQSTDAHYADWERGTGGAGGGSGPWRRVRAAPRALLRRALQPAPDHRATLAHLLQHRWLEPAAAAGDGEEGSERAWRSQPAAAVGAAAGASCASPAALSPAAMEALISYSQPSRAEDLVLPGSLHGGRLRLTRVPVACGWERALEAARARLCACGLQATLQGARSLLVDCGEGVAMRARAWPLPQTRGGGALIEFRRARGCGLRFQRHFRDVRRALAPLAPPAPPAHMDLF